VKFVKKQKISNIRYHESELADRLFKHFLNSDKIIVYNDFNREKFVPILSFNVGSLSGEETASLLAKENIAVRGGFHCNPSAHDFYKTSVKGTVRASFSVFNTKKDIDYLINCANKIAKITQTTINKFLSFF
jgi:selenocysteine lyase/cysteine desulfurase